ncbi:MAG: MBOAT family O-acyltransferase [Bacteroidota bacterium]
MIDWLKDILLYDESTPLLFTRLYFWGFFAIVLVVYSIVYRNKAVRNAYIFLISLFFYYKTSGFFVSILIVSTISDFFIGQRIYATQNNLGKKLWLVLSVFINLFILTYFKYAYFFTDAFNTLLGTDYTPVNHFAYWTNSFFGTHFRFEKIILPVGVSFFTFQTISYSVDVFRGLVKPVRNILDFGFYVSFFPQLVAGPIVRAADFVPQLYKDYTLTKEQFGMALFMILNGLIKKLFLADYIAVNFIDRVFANPLSYTGFENLMALYGYSLQVYADFSGYTDIAIGLALLMGFRLPKNFNSPYKATSTGEFWKRWHISLSSWLKDYLYIPMGGNRSGSFFSYLSMFVIAFFITILAASIWVPVGIVGLMVAVYLLGRIWPAFRNWVSTNINLMMTMLLGGLWHGASWNFVVWGGLNGVGIVIYKLWKKLKTRIRTKLGKPETPEREKWYGRMVGIFITFNFITFTRIWFRSSDFEIASQVLNQITQHLSFDVAWGVLAGYKWVFITMLIGYTIHWLPTPWKEGYKMTFVRLPYVIQVVVAFAISFFLYQVLSSDMQPFIYFAF